MPSEYKPPEYKPPKMCLKMSISPGLIFWYQISTLTTLYPICNPNVPSLRYHDYICPHRQQVNLLD